MYNTVVAGRVLIIMDYRYFFSYAYNCVVLVSENIFLKIFLRLCCK
jgi:hypothetical protein